MYSMYFFSQKCPVPNQTMESTLGLVFDDPTPEVDVLIAHIEDLSWKHLEASTNLSLKKGEGLPLHSFKLMTAESNTVTQYRRAHVCSRMSVHACVCLHLYLAHFGITMTYNVHQSTLNDC